MQARVLASALLCVASSALAGCSSAGPEAGLWCRNMPASEAKPAWVKLLVLDGEGSYWIIDGVTIKDKPQRYEMAEEGGVWYWHSWYGDAEYANRVARFEEGKQLVLHDKNTGRYSYYYYLRDFAGMPKYTIQVLEQYNITEELQCPQR